MKNLETLKSAIESGHVPDDLIIFLCASSHFIPDQYVKEIAAIKGKKIVYEKNLESFLETSVALFDDTESGVLSVIKIQKLTSVKPRKHNLIIICQEIDETLANDFKNYITPVPRLEKWQLKDYITSLLEGADSKDVEAVINRCGDDPYRIEEEITKVSIFPRDQKKYVLKGLLESFNFASDISAQSIFSFTTALLNKDTESLKRLLREIKNMDVEAFGVISILLKGLRDRIDVWLSPNPSVATTSLTPAAFFTVSKLPRVFSRESLIKVFSFILSLDSKVKKGEILESFCLDLIVIKMLSL